jgi:hypothetical protein
MMRLTIVAVTLAAFGAAAPASAFHPFDDTSGYVMPEKFKKRQKSAKSAKTRIKNQPRSWQRVHLNSTAAVSQTSRRWRRQR